MKLQEATQRMKPFIGQLLVLAAIFECRFAEIVEVCNSENFQISCQTNEVIYVKSAEFGRMDVGRCIKKKDDFLGCSNDVLSLLDQWCSGRQQCRLFVTNDDLEEANTNCLEILIKYLKIDYSCLKVEAMCSSSHPNRISGRNGYISSSILDRKVCGSSKSPWIISANPGQNIHLDIIDFNGESASSSFISCGSVYGFVIERSLGINYTICGGQRRERTLYTSKTNSIEVHLFTKESRKGANFLIHHTVVGCPELVPPSRAWYKREGSEAVIGCDNNDKKWRLTCVEKRWVGDVGNCSEAVPTEKEEIVKHEFFHMSSIVVISGIAGIAVVLSVVAIVIGTVYINKYRMKQEMKRANLYKTYSTIGSNVQAYYRPVTVDQSENNGTCWDMSLVPPNQMTLLSDKCKCPTLQMRNQGEGDTSLERQSLYSSIRST